jgi:hypothetical protein
MRVKSRFKVPVKVEQVNENLFSDTTKCNNERSVNEMGINGIKMTMR